MRALTYCQLQCPYVVPRRDCCIPSFVSVMPISWAPSTQGQLKSNRHFKSHSGELCERTSNLLEMIQPCVNMPWIFGFIESVFLGEMSRHLGCERLHVVFLAFENKQHELGKDRVMHC